MYPFVFKISNNTKHLLHQKKEKKKYWRLIDFFLFKVNIYAKLKE